MRFHESHFWYNKSQRNGILILASLITSIQVFIYFSDELIVTDRIAESADELRKIERQLDSMRDEVNDSRNFQIYPFNPNYISDFKGYVLGMSPEQIDRLLDFRKEGKFVRSAKEFQNVTGVKDSLLDRISVHFRFPEFAKRERPYSPTGELGKPGPNSIGVKEDLNKVTEEDLQKVKGIGPVLAKRIIAYRSLLGGFSFEDQLFEVYRLPEEAIENMLQRYEIKQMPRIEKLNVNTASFKQILDLPYIDYELTRKIMAFRSEEKVITDLSDLKEIDSFPLDKYDRIAVYLSAE